MMPEKRFAILVGINDYSDSPLSYCVNDALSMQQILTNKCGFEKDRVKVIISTKEEPKQIDFG